ncbi:MAG: hypothetical protein IBX44_08605 [Sulfurospirillum sp.]|nr:hypothetical protein [Sulfurospirillum sp.]
MAQAVEYFSIFGGLDLAIDLTQSLENQIQKYILDDYRALRNTISDFTDGDVQMHALLSGIALGDRKSSSAFKRAKLSFNAGVTCVDILRQRGVLSLESSYHHLKRSKNYEDIADKLQFSAPFLRFWFAFVSPLFQGIKAGNYEEFFTNFHNKIADFHALTFEQLCHEFVKKTIEEDRVYELGRYWDSYEQIDLLGKTRSGKIIAGVCKFTKAKVKTSELTKLQATCKALDLDVGMFLVFAKNGFSAELKSLKNEQVKLFTSKHLKVLC